MYFRDTTPFASCRRTHFCVLMLVHSPVGREKRTHFCGEIAAVARLGPGSHGFGAKARQMRTKKNPPVRAGFSLAFGAPV